MKVTWGGPFNLSETQFRLKDEISTTYCRGYSMVGTKYILKIYFIHPFIQLHSFPQYLWEELRDNPTNFCGCVRGTGDKVTVRHRGWEHSAPARHCRGSSSGLASQWGSSSATQGNSQCGVTPGGPEALWAGRFPQGAHCWPRTPVICMLLSSTPGAWSPVLHPRKHMRKQDFKSDIFIWKPLGMIFHF